MVDMKSLERAVTGAAKGSGYTLIVAAETWYFVAHDWMAITELETLKADGRNVMGMVVEQMGELPMAGAWHICKVKDGYDVQDEMQDVAMDAVAAFVGDVSGEIRRTLLNYGRYSLWQDREGKIYGTDGGAPRWTDKALYQINEKQCLQVSSCGDALYKRLGRFGEWTSEQFQGDWEHLESRMWVDWEAET